MIYFSYFYIRRWTIKLNLYSISNKYIKHLRQFDDKIYDNKEEFRTHERKYLGIKLFIIHNIPF